MQMIRSLNKEQRMAFKLNNFFATKADEKWICFATEFCIESSYIFLQKINLLPFTS